MLMSPKFKQVEAVNGVIEFPRSGVASKLVLPEDLKKRINYDVNTDPENNRVVFSGGDSVYIITEHFGVVGGPQEEVDSNIFFIDGGIVIELLSGKIFMKGENGEIFSVNEVGDIDYPTEHAKSKIYWVTSDDVRTNATRVTQYKYSLSDVMAPKYVDNFAYNTQFHYVNTSGGYILKTKFAEYYGDLALDKFQFVDYASAGVADADDDHVDISELEDIEEEDEFPEDGEDSYEGVL